MAIATTMTTKIEVALSPMLSLSSQGVKVSVEDNDASWLGKVPYEYASVCCDESISVS